MIPSGATSTSALIETEGGSSVFKIGSSPQAVNPKIAAAMSKNR